MTRHPTSHSIGTSCPEGAHRDVTGPIGDRSRGCAEESRQYLQGLLGYEVSFRPDEAETDSTMFHTVGFRGGIRRNWSLGCTVRGVEDASSTAMEDMMKTLAISRPTLLALLLAALTVSEGCQAVEGIFKAGFWVGIVIAVVVVGAVFALFRAIGS